MTHEIPIIAEGGQALIYRENEFGKIDGKVANGLIRQSHRFEIVGVVDSTKAGLDAGECLGGAHNGIPVFPSVADALRVLGRVPDYFVYGIAPLAPLLNQLQRETIFDAMRLGMNIVNGLPEFFTDDAEFVQQASVSGVRIHDVRKPPPREALHPFTGRIRDINTPIVAVFGTDCAVGKRTTAIDLVDALRHADLNAVFIATGQTGLLQGSKYGVAVDVLTSGYAAGEVENAIIAAEEQEHPDIIVVEGQGALSHPAFTSSSAILKGAVPDAFIIQHSPRRKNHCDYPNIPMPTLESEIRLIELNSRSRVNAIAISHEDMNDDEVEETIAAYEQEHRLPTTDVLKHGCSKLVDELLVRFPELQKRQRRARKTEPSLAGLRHTAPEVMATQAGVAIPPERPPAAS